MPELVARSEYVRQLVALLKKAAEGSLQITFVAGEAGIGKTSLLDLFARGVRQRLPNLRIAKASCYSIIGSSHEAYLPFEEILRALIQHDADHSLVDKLKRAFVEIAPEWISVIPVVGDVAAATMRTAQWARKEFREQGTSADARQLIFQYTSALKLIAEQAPLLLVIDDLHWSDNATLDLISFLADHLSRSRIMILCAYRQTDIASSPSGSPHPLRKLIGKLERYGQCSTLALRGFSYEDLRQYLHESNYAFSAEATRTLLYYSGGNPLFTREYLRLLEQRQMLELRDGRWAIMGDALPDDIPNSVNLVINQRLDLLEPDIRRVLNIASVQGKRFRPLIVGAMVDLTETELFEKLNCAERDYHLIREVESGWPGEGETEYEFVHALIQTAIYERLGQGQKRQLHLTVAHAIERGAADPARHASDLAIHFARAHQYPSAIKYHLLACESALAALAFDDAIVHAQAILEFTAILKHEPSAGLSSVRALLLLAESYYWKADFAEALRVCERAEALCVSLSLHEQQAYTYYWRAAVAGSQGKYDEVVQPIRRALELLGEAPANPRLQGYLYTLLGRRAHLLPIREVVEFQNAALAIAEQHTLTDIKVRALVYRAWTYTNWLDNYDQALAGCHEVLPMAIQQRMISEEIYCRRVMAFAYLYTRQGAQALFQAETAVALAREHHLLDDLHRSLSLLAICWREVRGEMTEALQKVREAVQICEQYNFSSRFDVLASWFDILFSAGEWAESAAALQKIYESYSSSYSMSGLYHCRKGLLLYARKQFAAAAAELRQAVTIYDRLSPNERDAQKVRPHLCLALIRAGHVAEARGEAQRAQAYWQGKNLTMQAFCALVDGTLLGLDDESEQAERLLSDAARLAAGSFYDHNTTVVPVLPQIQAALATLFIQSGRAREALDAAQAAHAYYKEHGWYLAGETAFLVGAALEAMGSRDTAAALYREGEAWLQRLETNAP